MKVRIPHKLKGNKKTYIPTQFIFYDTETSQVKRSKYSTCHKLKLGWACYWKRENKSSPEILKYKYFEDPGTFWDFVEVYTRAKTRLVIIAHNIVFDHTIVRGWNEPTVRGWLLTRLYEKNHTFIAKYKKGSASLLLLDNMNYFACPLAVLGKQIGLSKIDVDFNTCTKAELSSHCKRDVEILVKTWQEYFIWFKTNDLGNFGVTISSQSFNTFRHRFMKNDIFIHNRRYVIDLERESYYGGRTECFKLGSYSSDKYYYLDINSMYPSVMRDNWYPVKYLTYDLKCTPTILKYYLAKYCIIARVLIKTDKPIVPFRCGKIKTSTVKPVGPEYYDPIKEIKQWVIEKGGIKTEYIKVGRKKRIREEYKDIPVLYRKSSGIPADELAASLADERPELYNLGSLDNIKYNPGDRLIDIVCSKVKEVCPSDIFGSLDEELDLIAPENNLLVTRSNKVIFPIGTFETVLATGELSLALAENAITKVISVAIYERAKIFDEFIAFFYNERLKAKSEGKTAYVQFYKLLMNSLYGKFGQQMGEWTTIGKCDPKEVDYYSEVVRGERHIYKYRKINGLVQRYEKKCEAFNSFAAISAHVTSYARVKMWQLINLANIENVYYCDTDSIFVNEQGYKNLSEHIHKDKLGKLKIEDTTNNLELIGCKNYVFGKHEKHKGRKKGAIKIDEKTYLQDQWGTLKSLILNKNLEDYKIRKVLKTFTGIYDKGNVDKKGNVKPLVL